MMAYLITKKGDKISNGFFIFFVALTAVLAVCTAASVPSSQNRDPRVCHILSGQMIMEYVIIGGSVIFWILLLQLVKKSADPMD